VLNDLDDFIAMCATNGEHFLPYVPSNDAWGEAFEPEGQIHCPGCGAPRKLRLWQATPARFPSRLPALGQPIVMGLNTKDRSVDAIARQLAPCLVRGMCLQDQTMFTFVLFEGPEGYELAVFANKRGGLSTPHTPAGVAYYLDQAQRAQSAAANSAAVAMYRAALEYLLYGEGFEMRMLGQKVQALEDAIAAGTAPSWTHDLNVAYMKVVGRLGNAVIHPGDGDISRQAAVDRGLLTLLDSTFAELLQLIYERKHNQDANLAALEAVLVAIE
jgi:hypothetical protein